MAMAYTADVLQAHGSCQLLGLENVIFGGIKVAGFVVLLDGNDEKKTKRCLTRAYPSTV